MFDNLCKSWPRGSQQCINRLKNRQTSYRVLNTVLIKVLYERCGSWPQKCYGDGYSTGWLRHFIATRRYGALRVVVNLKVQRKPVLQLAITCEQALLFGRAKPTTRERASTRRSREGPAKGELATIPYKFPFVLRPDEGKYHWLKNDVPEIKVDW